jgi:hypothetical protein
MNVYQQISEDIKTYFFSKLSIYAWTVKPKIEIENRDKQDIAISDLWLRLTVQFVRQDIFGAYSSNYQSMEHGVLYIQLFIPKNTGTINKLEMLEFLTMYFVGITISDIYFRESNLTGPHDNDTWNMYLWTIPFKKPVLHVRGS